MIRNLLTRTAIPLLALVLLTSPAFALGGRTARQEREPGVLAAFRQILAALVPASPAVEKGRGTIDPNGAATDSTPPPSDTDGRGTIDPNG